MKAGRRVDDGSKQEGEQGANGRLSGQLGEEVGRHSITALGPLPLHDGALLGEDIQALHQAAHGRIDGPYLQQQPHHNEQSQRVWLLDKQGH